MALLLENIKVQHIAIAFGQFPHHGEHIFRRNLLKFVKVFFAHFHILLQRRGGHHGLPAQHRHTFVAGNAGYPRPQSTLLTVFKAVDVTEHPNKGFLHGIFHIFLVRKVATANGTDLPGETGVEVFRRACLTVPEALNQDAVCVFIRLLHEGFL